MLPNPDSPLDVRALRAGNSATWDLLYADYAPRVLGYLLRIGVTRADAEDLVQETFLAAYDGRRGFRGSSQPLAWLLGISRRRWRDRLRHAHPTESPPDDLPDNRDVAAEVTSDVAVEAWLAQLPLSDREIIVLAVMHGLTYREIAEIVGKPVGTVKWRAAEALKYLRTVVPLEETFSHDTRPEPRPDARPASPSANRQSARPARPAPPTPDCP